MRAAVVLLVLTASVPAAAAPPPELVVYWASPGAAPTTAASVAATSRELGLAFVDHSPPATAVGDARALVALGREAYDALRFDDAVVALDRATASLDATGGLDLDHDELADLFLYRGLAKLQLAAEAEDGAWDDLTAAARVAPHRTLDPSRFPPRAVAALARAQAAIAAQPRGTLELRRWPDCRLRLDGRPVAAGAVEVPVGAHWLRVTCPAMAAWGARVEVGPGLQVVTPPPPPRLSDDAALIQARALGSAALLVVEVFGETAVVRVLEVDGRLRSRAAAPVGEVAAALRRAAQPPPPRGRWYRSRWTFAVAGGLAVAAALVPLLLVDDSDAAPRRQIRPTGLPW